jgi:quercetin dioxygenase-like cupin family protein
MTDSGYAIASLDAVEWTSADEPARARTATLTESLGCRHTTVDGLRLHGDEPVALSSGREQVCVPVDATQPLELNEGITVPPDGVGRIPAGVTGSVRCAGAASVVVVGAPASETPDAAAVAVSLDDREFALPSTSDIATARLTDPLGCRGLKLNARRLDPGDVVPYHTEGDQEELFVPVSGPAAMRIADDSFETPPGTVARVAPAVPRSAINDGDTDAVWVMFGAPPTGGPDEWDPGAEILE